jgi:hypothetical protein
MTVAPQSKDEGLAPDRLFAIPKPLQQAVWVCFDRGTVSLSIAEARAIHGALGGALEIYDGQHPAQEPKNWSGEAS